jgi:hypothetical protein
MTNFCYTELHRGDTEIHGGDYWGEGFSYLISYLPNLKTEN